MKVILLKDVSKLGRKYDTKDVSSGYALNLLIPQGIAIAATPDAVKRIDVMKKKAEGERKVQEELMLKNIAELEGITLYVSGKANEKGHLFAGIHRDQLSAELSKQTNLEIEPSAIEVEHPIKELGEHQINVSAGGKKVSFKLIIRGSTS